MPKGPWSKEAVERVLAAEDDGFLDAVETWEIDKRTRLFVDDHELDPGILSRLLKMADARPVLRRIEWAGPNKTCPACGGFKPGDTRPVLVGRIGHDSECHLAFVLDA